MRTAVIIGAGPAGLTAAWELLSRSDIAVTVLEKTGEIGGLSRTVNYKGNRLDIGGHRFFSKSERVMSWWLDVLPLQSTGSARPVIAYHGGQRQIDGAPTGADPDREDRVLLLRRRRSRIYYLRRFFDYPVTLSLDTLAKLGLAALCALASATSAACSSPSARSGTWSSSSSTASGASSTSPSSSPIQRRCGGSPATASARSGARKG